LEQLPTLIDAAVLDRRQQPIGTLADAAIELRSGRIRHYLVSRSDPRLPGSSRWRLSLDRLLDQQPGQVLTALESIDDLPLARASVRQEFLRRSRRWRDQVQEAGSRFEERLEGWLEEPPWQEESPSPLAGEAPDEGWDDWPESLDSSEPPSRPSAPDGRRQRRSAQPPNDEDPWF
jgi:hypothetical protein